MDEILIEEKRYISSKQAAKLTGYAKDYVGQLCREGRVPARLVGRSWYVLESAIQDHRFGPAVVEPTAKPKSESVFAPLSAHMQPPRYTPSSEEIVPSIEEENADQAQDNSPEAKDPEDNLQESWGSWFEKVEVNQELASAPTEQEETVPIEKNEEIIAKESVEVNVPVRAIHHAFYQPEMDELPRIARKDLLKRETDIKVEKQEGLPYLRAIRLAGAMVSVISIIVALIGTGYFDDYLISNRQVSLVAGVSLYNK